jgi:FkbH-like protein
MDSLTRLRRRFHKDRDLPILSQLAEQAASAARFVTHATLAPAALRSCDVVGKWVRTKGGVPVVINKGRIEIDAHTVLSSMYSPVVLETGPSGRIIIGQGCDINFGCVIRAQKRIVIGDSVLLGPYCTVADATDSPASEATEAATVEIGDEVWLAARVTILPGSRIGAGTVITAGSTVSGEIPAGVIAGGIPARVIRSLLPEDSGKLGSPSSVEALFEETAPQRVPRGPLPALDAVADCQSEIVATEERPAPAAAKMSALLVADFTAQEFADLLMEDTEAPRLQVDVAPYQQVVPTLLSLDTGAQDLVIVWTLPESTIPSFARLMSHESVDEKVLLDEVDAFAGLLASSLRGVKCAVVPTWTVPSYNRGLGAIDLRPGGIAHALMAMNKRLAEQLREQKHIYVVNAQRWLEQTGRTGRPPKLWYMGKIAFSSDAFREAVGDVKATLCASTGRTRKLLVVDLDDTIWGGIVGDVGWEGLRLGGHDSVGEAFVDFQHAVKSLKNRGVLLACASKNEESVALHAIRSNGEMVLREEDFACHRINWLDKAHNINEIVIELNLGLQSVVFIDDNPVERARVRDALPEVFVPEWPEDKHLYASTLLGLRCFDAATISAEDLQRTEMMHASRKRAAPSPDLGSIDDWIASLDIRLVAARVSSSTLARTAQLLNKTNQLNLSTRRLSESELMAWADAPNREMWDLHVSDKFGDSGLTGIVSLEVNGTTARVVDYVLSCRVMGRKVEEALLYLVVSAAKRHGATKLEAELLPTAKNKPCLDFWRRSGWERHGDYHFRWKMKDDYPMPKALRLTVEGEGSKG